MAELCKADLSITSHKQPWQHHNAPTPTIPLSCKLYDAIYYSSETKIEPADITDEFAKGAAKRVTEHLRMTLESFAFVYETARLKEVPIANRHDTSIKQYSTQTPEEIDAGSDAQAREYTLRVVGDAIAAHRAQEAMSEEIGKSITVMGWE